MLSIFPIMFLAPLAHTLLRLFVGGVFLYFGLRHATRDRGTLRDMMTAQFPALSGILPIWIILMELLIAVMLIVGAAAQIAALLGILFSLKLLFLRKRFTPPIFAQSMVYVLLLGACLSLAITGAGALAVDLPI